MLVLFYVWGILPVCMSLFRVCAVHLEEEGVRHSGTGVNSGCELQYGCLELSPGPVKEQSVF